MIATTVGLPDDKTLSFDTHTLVRDASSSSLRGYDLIAGDRFLNFSASVQECSNDRHLLLVSPSRCQWPEPALLQNIHRLAKVLKTVPASTP